MAVTEESLGFWTVCGTKETSESSLLGPGCAAGVGLVLTRFVCGCGLQVHAAGFHLPDGHPAAVQHRGQLHRPAADRQHADQNCERTFNTRSHKLMKL